ANGFLIAGGRNSLCVCVVFRRLVGHFSPQFDVRWAICLLLKMTDSISTRSAKLNQIFAGKNVARKTSNACFTREAMLDAFLLLFEECSSEFMLKDKNVAGFVKKYQAMVDDLRTLCLSKDDFNVINTIGRGHFGQVQVVKEKQSGDVFALKTLKKSQTLAQEIYAALNQSVKHVGHKLLNYSDAIQTPPAFPGGKKVE
ncbi:Citron Rho-interacting kinase, partial [Acropora cervicornis]